MKHLSKYLDCTVHEETKIQHWAHDTKNKYKSNLLKENKGRYTTKILNEKITFGG
jgi:hypothetical protein